MNRQIDEIREKISIVEIISEYTELTCAGSQHKGLCPFHSEKTPSFSVNDKSGLYYCFGCGKKGSVFDFVMEKRGFSFVEALKFLAQKAGVVLEQSSQKEWKNPKESAFRRLCYEALELAARSYERVLGLDSGKSASKYLLSRGIGEKVASVFRLGYAPGGWSFIEGDVSEGLGAFSEVFQSAAISQRELLFQVGLLKQKEEKFYDAFRGRVIFPISRSDGRVIAFGAREFAERGSGAKYLNSPQSAIYHKRRSFYAINHALPLIREKNTALICEGYTDVISLFQAGFCNAIASCGTAFGQDHALVLKRICKRAVLLFDGDEAGRKAASNAFIALLNSGIDGFVASLPEGEDPDTLIRGGKPDVVAKAIEKPRPLFEVYLENISGAKGEALSPVQVGEVGKKLTTLLSSVINPLVKESYLRTACDYLGVSAESFRKLLSEAEAKKRQVNRAKANAPKVIRSIKSDPKADSAMRLSSPLDRWQNLKRELLLALSRRPELAARLRDNEQAKEFFQKVDFGGVLDSYKGLGTGGVDCAWVSSSQLVASSPELEILRNVLSSQVERPEEILSEAIRQLSVGGSDPEQVITCFLEGVSALLSEISLFELRSRERGELNSDEKVQLAQAKLMEKARLEKSGKQPP